MDRPRVTGGRLAADRVLVAYLCVTGVLAAVSGTVTGRWLAAIHLLVAGLLFVVTGSRRRPRSRTLQFLRGFYPVAVTPIFYAELSVLDQLFRAGFLDAVVRGWEMTLFHVELSLELSRWLPYLGLSELLHLGYFCYYLIIPGLALWVYVTRGPEALQRVTLTIALAFYFCYVCFMVFPVAGPRYLLPGLSGPPGRGAIHGLVHHVLDSASSKGTAFPSSHVAASLSALLATWREERAAFWTGLFPVSFLVLGTVYGRFHYGVDAAAGILVAGLAWWAAGRISSRPAL